MLGTFSSYEEGRREPSQYIRAHVPAMDVYAVQYALGCWTDSVWMGLSVERAADTCPQRIPSRSVFPGSRRFFERNHVFPNDAVFFRTEPRLFR